MRDKKIVKPKKIDTLKNVIDIVKLVGESVQLRKNGSAYVGKCPFHEGRGNDLHVVPSRKFWHCFSCEKHGDAITWVQTKFGFGREQAIIYLGDKFDVDVSNIVSLKENASETEKNNYELRDEEKKELFDRLSKLKDEYKSLVDEYNKNDAIKNGASIRLLECKNKLEEVHKSINECFHSWLNK